MVEALKRELNGLAKRSKEIAKKVDLAVELFRKGQVTLDEVALLTGLPKDRLEQAFEKAGFIDRKTIMVCGGAGFIGSNFIHYLLDKYHHYRVINYDKLTYAGNLDNHARVEDNPNYTFIKGDISDLEHVRQVIDKEGVDIIVNFAAETHVDRSIHEGAAAFVWTNVVGVQVLLDAVRDYDIERFIHFSTDEVFGSIELDEERSFKEDDAFAPNVPYAAAKAGGDLLCRAYHKTYGVPVIVTHCSNNYGPYQYLEKFIPYITFRAMHNQSVPIYGDGKHVRDWLYVLDNCQAVDTIMHQGAPGEVYNISASNEWHNLDVAHKVLKILGKPKSLIKHVADRPGHDRRYSIDCSKIKSQLKWQPAQNFDQMLEKTIGWYVDNPDWVKNLIKKARVVNGHIVA